MEVTGMEKERQIRSEKYRLWKRLETAAEGHQIDWQWVKGHDGHEMNERCDTLATEAADGEYGALIDDSGFEG